MVTLRTYLGQCRLLGVHPSLNYSKKANRILALEYHCVPWLFLATSWGTVPKCKQRAVHWVTRAIEHILWGQCVNKCSCRYQSWVRVLFRCCIPGGSEEVGKETLSLNLRIVITATKELIIQTLLEWVVGWVVATQKFRLILNLQVLLTEEWVFATGILRVKSPQHIWVGL